MITKELWLRDGGFKGRNNFRYEVEYIKVSEKRGIIHNHTETFSNKKDAIKEINKWKKGMEKVEENWYKLEEDDINV